MIEMEIKGAFVEVYCYIKQLLEGLVEKADSC